MYTKKKINITYINYRLQYYNQKSGSGIYVKMLGFLLNEMLSNIILSKSKECSVLDSMF